MWSPRRWGASGASVTTAWWFDNVHEENNDQVSSLGYRIFGQTHVVIPDYLDSLSWVGWKNPPAVSLEDIRQKVRIIDSWNSSWNDKSGSQNESPFFYFYSCVRSSFCDCLILFSTPFFDVHPNLISVFWMDWTLKSPISQFWLLINFNVPWVPANICRSAHGVGALVIWLCLCCFFCL